MKNLLALFIALILLQTTGAQTIAPLYQDYLSNKWKGITPDLPDFSYAGYHFSEKAIPDVAGKKHFNVTDYGAQPNDEQFDDEAIQKAILAAEANAGGGVVFFPPGKYLIAPDTVRSKHIRVSKSNIVLKGSGTGENGTEIFQANMRVKSRQIQFSPGDTRLLKLTTLRSNVARGSFVIEVANAAKLRPGQDVVIRHRSEAFTKNYFQPHELKPEWTRLFGNDGGMQVFAIHTITKINGNKVTLKNPVQLDIVVEEIPWDVHGFTAIEECGIEDILFTSNWQNYPEEFVHHKDDIHDYAYETIGMQFVKNSWIKNCEFRHVNEGIFIRSGYQLTISNVHFTGKKGHSSVHARTGYGVLVKDCTFNGAHHHGPGTGYSAVNTVFTNCTLATDQNIDIHSGQPIATLYDNIKGGVFTNLGGPIMGHPHHGKHLVLWNFQHQSAKDQHYNFWDMTRRRNFTIAFPYLVGFQSNTKVTFQNEGINQLQDQQVAPLSLFKAQLQHRLQKQ